MLPKNAIVRTRSSWKCSMLSSSSIMHWHHQTSERWRRRIHRLGNNQRHQRRDNTSFDHNHGRQCSNHRRRNYYYRRRHCLCWGRRDDRHWRPTELGCITLISACSSAYTTCHADFTSCSAFLAGQPGANGVTVSVAGGGGTTVVASAAVTTYAPDFASSVCASLSGSACYGLTVEACGRFGGATATSNANGAAAAARRTGIQYAVGVGAGVALGVVGYG